VRRGQGIYRWRGKRGEYAKAIWQAFDPEKGKVRQFSKTFGPRNTPKGQTSYQAARAHRDDTLVSIRTGNYIPDSSITFGDYWTRFLEEARDLRPATRDLYERMARLYIFPAFEHSPIRSVTKRQISAWVHDLASKVNLPTLEAAFRTLRRVLSAAEDDEPPVILRNPARKVRLPKAEDDGNGMRTLSHDELRRVYEAIAPRYRALILLMGLCGLRVGEAIALTVADLNVLRRQVRVSKAATEVRGKVSVGPTKTRGSRRAIQLPNVVADALASHLATFPPGQDGLVFTAEGGGYIRRTNFRRRVWQPALQEAGIAEPWPRVHDLRHSAATLSLEAGVHPKIVQAMLGHSRIGTTLDRYSHVTDRLTEDAAGKLDAGFREASGEGR
jgi:integrase